MLQVETPNTSNNLENEPHMSLVHWMFLRSQTCSRLYLVSLAEGRRAAALMLLWDVGLLRERSVFDLLYQRWPLVSNWVSTAITIAASLSLNHRGFVYVCVCVFLWEYDSVNCARVMWCVIFLVQCLPISCWHTPFSKCICVIMWICLVVCVFVRFWCSPMHQHSYFYSACVNVFMNVVVSVHL